MNDPDALLARIRDAVPGGADGFSFDGLWEAAVKMIGGDTTPQHVAEALFRLVDDEWQDLHDAAPVHADGTMCDAGGNEARLVRACRDLDPDRSWTARYYPSSVEDLADRADAMLAEAKEILAHLMSIAGASGGNVEMAGWQAAHRKFQSYASAVVTYATRAESPFRSLFRADAVGIISLDWHFVAQQEVARAATHIGHVRSDVPIDHIMRRIGLAALAHGGANLPILEMETVAGVAATHLELISADDEISDEERTERTKWEGAWKAVTDWIAVWRATK